MTKLFHITEYKMKIKFVNTIKAKWIIELGVNNYYPIPPVGKSPVRWN